MPLFTYPRLFFTVMGTDFSIYCQLNVGKSIEPVFCLGICSVENHAIKIKSLVNLWGMQERTESFNHQNRLVSNDFDYEICSTNVFLCYNKQMYVVRCIRYQRLVKATSYNHDVRILSTNPIFRCTLRFTGNDFCYLKVVHLDYES